MASGVLSFRKNSAAILRLRGTVPGKESASQLTLVKTGGRGRFRPVTGERSWQQRRFILKSLLRPVASTL